MNLAAIIRRMERFPAVLREVTAPLTEDEWRAKPPSEAWSILEIVAHLADEEVEDFRARLGSTLKDPKAPWAPTDPEGWARQRKYNGMSPAEVLERFTRERAASIAWLKSLPEVDWKTAYHHPRHGPVHAGELMASWPAHDALHLRQIAKRLFERAATDAPGFSTRYAGEWGP